MKKGIKEDNWIEVLLLIDETKGCIKPISLNDETYDFNIFGLKEKMMGYIIVWNVNPF